jgi:hypothetical protein
LEEPIAYKQSKFLTGLKEAKCQTHMEAMFLYSCAPIIRGLKAGALIRIPNRCRLVWNQCQKALCDASSLEALKISTRRGIDLLFLYDRKAVATALQNPGAKALLTSLHYEETEDPERALEHLQGRFSMEDCPHEVGIFLGYPPEDVQAFIDNAGKNCLCCRYWKVYHDAQTAQETFHKIDAAVSDAIDLLSESIPIHVVTQLLKAV